MAEQGGIHLTPARLAQIQKLLLDMPYRYAAPVVAVLAEALKDAPKSEQSAKEDGD